MDLRNFRVGTERLVLRVVRPDDIEALCSLMTEGISRWVAAWPFPLTAERASGIVAPALEKAGTGHALPMVMVERSSTAIAGWIKLDIDGGIGDLGYWVGEAAQGRGYALEAARAIINAAFGELGLHAIEAGAQPANAASHHLLAKLGMHEIGERLVYAPARQRHGVCRFWRLERPVISCHAF
ncbi:GNAT family N-acetyltransferase [Stappia sp. F7233]|uniref:GNAT family N-acetyltransferase n=1 Tax=Stappia albiluteola TaxID=2758565 RepID=A0A839ADA2_9HYPH|nr:GNAT family N-acetyltransferase [Stappia albiluteola]MBA5777653.1 GNAT family N-acetyltransferase [Stappia albiluteola]